MKKVLMLFIVHYASFTLLHAGLTDFKTIKEANQAYEVKEYGKSAALLNTLETKSPQKQYDIGNALYKDKKYDEAIKAYEKAEGIDEAARLHNIGNTHFQKKDLGKAIESYEKALTLKEDEDTKFNLELAKKQKKQQEEQKKQEQKDKDKKDDKKNDKDQNKDDKKDQDQKKDQKDQDQKKEEPKSATMKCWVSMDCEACKAKIEKNLPFEKGVTGLKVDLPTKTVEVTYKTAKTSPEKLEKAIQKLGFKTEIIPEKKSPSASIQVSRFEEISNPGLQRLCKNYILI